MKLLLTSNGLSNDSIKNALEELVGKPRKETRISFVPTAGLAQSDKPEESKSWLADDIYRIKEFCNVIDIVSLADLPTEDVIKRLEMTDVIFVGGGNAFYLSYWFEQHGLFEKLPELLESRVYAGISSGSMITTASIRTASQAVNDPDLFYEELYDLLGPKGKSAGRSAQWVPFVIRPHYMSKSFPKVQGDYLEKIHEDVGVPLYAIDDMTALKVVDGQVKVISEGQWKLYDK